MRTNCNTAYEKATKSSEILEQSFWRNNRISHSKAAVALVIMASMMDNVNPKFGEA